MRTVLWIAVLCLLPSVILAIAFRFRTTRRALDRADERLRRRGARLDLLLVWVVMSVIVAALSLLTPRSAWREHRANRKLKREDPPEWRRRQAALRDVF